MSTKIACFICFSFCQRSSSQNVICAIAPTHHPTRHKSGISCSGKLFPVLPDEVILFFFLQVFMSPCPSTKGRGHSDSDHSDLSVCVCVCTLTYPYYTHLYIYGDIYMYIIHIQLFIYMCTTIQIHIVLYINICNLIESYYISTAKHPEFAICVYKNIDFGGLLELKHIQLLRQF